VTADPQDPAAVPATPFLKWPGGKSQLLPQFDRLFPPALLRGEISTYVEPFAGAGAVFFHVAHRCTFRHAYLFDINPELCLTYRVVQKRVDELLDELGRLRERYRRADPTVRERLFYRVREEYNAARHGFDYRALSPAAVHRAAQVIFLNKTCYNGLFRTNSSGAFNSPFGRYKDPAMFGPENLRRASRLLRRATVTCGDFESCERHADGRTFVYFDPPYRPLSRTASFTAYSKGTFNDTEQQRLARFFTRLDRQRKALLMLSNSDPANVDRSDRFFDELYGDYRIERVRAARSINSNTARRGSISELVILNY